jgi:hypothetical protein
VAMDVRGCDGWPTKLHGEWGEGTWGPGDPERVHVPPCPGGVPAPRDVSDKVLQCSCNLGSSGRV